jgi:hypothetical protein
MNRSRKLIPIVALAISLIMPTSAPAAEEKESFFPASIQRDSIDDKIFSTGETAGFNFSGLSQAGQTKPCASTADPNCNFNDAKWGVKTILATPILTLCTANENEDCIESIEISRSGGAFQKLMFEKYVEGGTCDPTAAAGCVFPPDRSKKLPRGGKLSVWSEIVDGKVQEIKYLVSYMYTMNYDDVNKYFVINKVNLAIRPMKEINSTRWDSLWFDNGKSGIQYDFQSNTEFKATLHLSNQVVGWFKARMQDVGVEISSFSPTNNRVVVSGKPVIVPIFVIKKSASSLTPKEKDFIDYLGVVKGVNNGEPGDPRIFEYIDYWRGPLKDVAAHTNTNWIFESTRWTSENPCLNATDRVLGVVSTNSMGYDGNPPKFVDGSLNYRVSGFHFGPDGKTPNLGTYDLVLRSDAARCLYGFSSAPVSATVSISGADGAQSVATTVVTEKDGWLKMKAAGFTYSEKQIKVKITQEGSVGKTISEKVEPISPIVNKVKKSSITCVKGKVTRKVTAISPKCPSGYKKKA